MEWLDNNKKVIFAIVAGGAVAYAIWYYYKHKERNFYTNLGPNSLDSLGPIDQNYEYVPPDLNATEGDTFADIVAGGNQVEFVQNAKNEPAMKRFERLQGSNLLPKTSKSLTPFNIDVADPNVYSFVASAPKVVLRDRVWDASDKVRGDIVITRKHGDSFNPMAGRSRYGRDSINMSGYFSDTYKELYGKLTGSAYRNMPMYVSAGETVMDL